MAFEREEVKSILILGLVSGFIIGFPFLIQLGSGGTVHIDYGSGLFWFILCAIGMAISVYIHEWGHKTFANLIGYETYTESYSPGLAVGVVLAFFSFGFLPFFTPNTSDLAADPIRRMNKHRKYENFRQQAFIAASGILVTAAVAIFLHGAYVLTKNKVIYRLLLGNVLLMVYSMVPFELTNLLLLRFQQTIKQIPISDGLYIVHYSVVAFITMCVFVLTLGLILLTTASVPVWAALLVALAVGTFVWFRFFLQQN